MLIHKEKNKKTKKNICFNNDSNSQIFVKTKNETTPPMGESLSLGALVWRGVVALVLLIDSTPVLLLLG